MSLLLWSRISSPYIDHVPRFKVLSLKHLSKINIIENKQSLFATKHQNRWAILPITRAFFQPNKYRVTELFSSTLSVCGGWISSPTWLYCHLHNRHRKFVRNFTSQKVRVPWRFMNVWITSAILSLWMDIICKISLKSLSDRKLRFHFYSPEGSYLSFLLDISLRSTYCDSEQFFSTPLTKLRRRMCKNLPEISTRCKRNNVA